MALYYSPRTVTDGLVLYLDAANTKSYPGTGTTWFDVSGNGNDGTLNNGPTYVTDNLGGFSFDGTNDSVSFGKNGSELGISDTAFTCDIVINRVDNPTNSSQGHLGFSSTTLSIKNTNRYFLNVRNTSDVEYFIDFHSGDDAEYLVDTVYLCFSVNGSTCKTYLNGSPYATQGIGSNIKTIQATDYSLSGGYGYFVSNSTIFSSKMYNRVLTDAEVLQNFRALADRYDL